MRTPVSRARWSAVHSASLFLAAAGGLLGQGACSQQSVTLPSRDFDRPTDMTFACLGLRVDDQGKGHPFGQPMGQCHPAGLVDPSPPPIDKGKSGFRTYAFVPNAERGDLSFIDMSYCRGADTCFPPGATLVDLDRLSVGYGAAPLGELPEVVASSQDGCRVISANRGSCDLTLVNPAVLLGRYGLPVDRRASSTDEGMPYARTIVPRTATGRLNVAPAEVAFLPQQTMGHDGEESLCDPGGKEGTSAAPVGAPAASAQSPATWRAVVTFPSCDLVALIDLPSGDILDSVQVTVDAGGYVFRKTGRNPVCPVSDCGGAPGGGGTPDAGAPDAEAPEEAGTSVPDSGADGSTAADGGGDAADPDAATAASATAAAPAAAALGVGPLAIHPEGHRVYFGAVNSPFIAALDITGAADGLGVPAAGANTELHDGARGVMRLRLSVDPYDYSKGHDAKDPTRAEYGRFVAGSHDDQPTDPLEFLYAIAKDGTIRVVHVGRTAPAECDLGIDPTDPKAGAVGPDTGVRPACFPYGAADGPRRMVFAGGPGLRLGGTPQDIAFANYRTPRKSGSDSMDDLDERVLNGAFAFVMTTTGTVQILNIDPELRLTKQRYRDANGELAQGRVPEEPRPLTHSPRDANFVTYTAALGPGTGPPRLASDPTAPVDGPRLLPFATRESRVDAHIVQASNPDTPRNAYVYFPNRATVNAQSWSIAWEGDLTANRITGDIVTPQERDAPPPMVTNMTDNGAGFCGVGVDGDVVTLVGCDTDAGCYAGDVCVHSTRVPPSVDGRPVQGICLHQQEVTAMRDRCERMMETFRRYEIVRNTPSQAVLVPKRVEVPRPVFTTPDGRRAACSQDAPSASANPHSCQPEMSTVHANFRCLEVTKRPDGTALAQADAAASPPALGDVSFRCLQPCTVDAECGQGRACLEYPGMSEKSVNDQGMVVAKPVPRVCAEGAPIDKWCGLQQLVQYRISAANAFVVAGSSSGRTERVRTRAGASGPECVPDFTSSPTLVARIPVNLPECSPATLPGMIGGAPVWDDAFLARAAAPSPNPCYVLTANKAAAGAQPMKTLVTGSDCHASDANCEVSVLFQNNELRFVMTDLQKPFSQTTLIRFDVNGGISPQVILPAADAAPGLPARLLLGPIPAADQSMPDLALPCGANGEACMPGRGSDLPYMYMVDQRQLVSGRVGVRGQILRVTPRVSDTTAPLPGIESFASGGRYFPIQ